MDHQHRSDQQDSSDHDERCDSYRPEAEHQCDDAEAASAEADQFVGESGADNTEHTGGGVLDLIAQVDQQLKRIREAQQTQDEELTSLADRFHQLEESERALQRERESLEAERSAFAQQREDIERMQVELGREREAWEREQREREERINEQHTSLREREEELARRQGELNEQLDELRQREEQLQQSKDGLDREREELHQRLEHAESQRADDESKMNELSQRLADAEQQRDEARNQLAEQKRQLDMAGQKLREFADALNEQNVQLDQAASAMALVKQQRRTIAELEEQLADRADEAGKRDANDQAEARINELTEQIHERDRQIESLTETIDRLHEEAAQESEGQTTTPPAAPDDKADADDLRAKARRIAEVATHVRRRQRRLRRMRELLRERADAANAHGSLFDAQTDEAPADSDEVHERHQALMQQVQDVEHRCEQVKQQQAALAAKERQMIRQWAKPRAVTVMLGVLVLLLANLAAAWGLAGHFFPAERTASITIEPRTTAGRSLEPETLERWQQWHTAIVHDETFIRALAVRLRERRLDEFSDPKELALTFRDRLTVDAGPGEQVTYTLAGHDAAALTGVLDVLAQTLVIESERQMSTRGDRVWAIARNERQEGGSLRYSLMNQWTLRDDRMLWMLPFLVGTLSLTALVIWLIYTRLIRAKQLFDELTSTIDGGDEDSLQRVP